MTPDTSGLSSVRPFASYDPASRSWRTWTAIGRSASTTYSGTWPKTGCMSDGLSYRLPAWEPRTSGSDCSSQSLHVTPRATRGGSSTETTMLLRTPNARDGEPRGTQPPEKRLEGGHQPSLSDQIEHMVTLPTPSSRGWKDGPPCANVPDNALLGRVVHQLLPTPAVNDMGAAYTPEQWDTWTARMKAEHNNGNGHGNSLNIEAQRVAMLPTPSVADGEGGHETRSGARSHERLLPGVAKYELLPTTTTMDAHGSGGNPDTTGTHGTTLTDATVRHPSRWGKYAAAIARWESITRPAPEPTNVTEGYLKARAKRLARLDRRPVGRRGSLRVRRQLAARFSEWMMGVPAGWITDVPGITRNEALKAAGNGVVPQQAAEALRYLLGLPTGREIAEAHEPVDLLELLAVDAS